MGSLNRLFGSTESTAKEMKRDEEALHAQWGAYLAAFPKKKELIEGMQGDKPAKAGLRQIRKMIQAELVELPREEHEASELVSDIESLEHEERIKRIRRLEDCLGYEKTQYEYVFHLLRHLYSILVSELRMIGKLESGAQDTQSLISHLRSQLQLETEVLDKIGNVKDFPGFFASLVQGQHIIHLMDVRERKFLKRMQEGMARIFSQELTEGITYEWAIELYNLIWEKVDEEIMSGVFCGNHPNLDLEFVNRPEFIGLAREVIQRIRKREVSDQMLRAFVHLFREWYNHGRD